MYIPAKTLDDLMRRVFEKLLASTNHIKPSKGPATEIVGVLLKIDNPRARLSRTELKGTLFSCLGELLWYLAKTNDLEFIEYYIPKYSKCSDDGKTVYGAYGPRFFNMKRSSKSAGIDQIANVIELLRRKPSSRQAVIQLFDAQDLNVVTRDLPCTCSMQFLIRHNKLHMVTYMRSNDSFLGLPHDVFAFTMLQEIMARTLDVKLGIYKHAVGSLHLYDRDIKRARQYLDEGWQSTVLMPKMPKCDPWPSISLLLEAENKIRNGQQMQVSDLGLAPYWEDLVRVLQIYAISKTRRMKEIERLKNEMSSGVYKPYIEKRQSLKVESAEKLVQLTLLK